MSNFVGRCIGLLLGLLLLFPTGVAVNAQDTGESQLDVVLKRDKLIVATYSTAPPLSYIDEKGELVGFEIDMARQLAKDILGDPNKVEFVIVQSDGRFPAVLSGKADIGIASTTINTGRAIRVAFTHPYMDTGDIILARSDANIKTLDDLNDPKFTFAMLNVPTNIERMAKYVPNVKLLLLDSPSALLLAVKTGRAQALTIDTPIASHFAGLNPDLVKIPAPNTAMGTIRGNGIFMKPGDFKFWLALDTAVREFRYGGRYLEYREWYRKWLHADPPPQRFYE